MALTTSYVAIQIQHFDAATKDSQLGLISACRPSARWSQPLFGVLSDQTCSPLRISAPWMVVGLMIGAIALITAGQSTMRR